MPPPLGAKLRPIELISEQQLAEFFGRGDRFQVPLVERARKACPGIKRLGLFAESDELRLFTGPVQCLLHDPESKNQPGGSAGGNTLAEHGRDLVPLSLQGASVHEYRVGQLKALLSELLRGL